MITSNLEVMRELHIRCTSSSKVLKRADVITDELDIMGPWYQINFQ